MVKGNTHVPWENGDDNQLPPETYVLEREKQGDFFIY